MIENLPWYISVTFIVTTFLTVGFFLFAVRQTVFETTSAKTFSFLIAFWLIFQAVFGIGGFYLKTDAVPPRLLLFGVFPALITIILFFVFARKVFIEKLPLKILTLLHIIRIPVEIVLFWLFEQKLVPQLMTFEGRNFDILSGLTAPLIYWLAFRGGKINRPLLIIWNIFALGLLINIVAHAILSFPFQFQQFAFDQPNRAVLYFPYVWLPTVIVPIVLFSHLISLWQLRKSNN
ncbi:hypothetical protein BH20ACI4_BH20ACI4_20030 [soil metagenome]